MKILFVEISGTLEYMWFLPGRIYDCFCQVPGNISILEPFSKQFLAWSFFYHQMVWIGAANQHEDQHVVAHSQEYPPPISSKVLNRQSLSVSREERLKNSGIDNVLTNFPFEIIVHLLVVWRNKTEISHVFFTQSTLMVTPYGTIIQYQNQDIDSDRVKI